MKKAILASIKLYIDSLRIPQVRSKIFKTILILFFFRLIVHIPVPGVKIATLKAFFDQNQIFALLDMFSGGTLANFSICALGLGPYINASVMFQLLGFIFPQIAELRKEGEYGRQKLTRYTRLLTIPLAVLQSLAMYGLLRSQSIIDNLPILLVVSFILTMTAGTLLAVFFGELINQYGIGSGISLIIFAGIVSRYPVSILKTLSIASGQDSFGLIIFLAMAVGVIAGVTFVDEAFLKVPIRYARRISAGRTAGQESYLPLKVNAAGVMPIIFALSLVSIPQMGGKFLSQLNSGAAARVGEFLAGTFAIGSLVYNIVYFAFVVAFAYVYTTVVFDPKEVAENLRKSGGFIPGVRPGISTEKRLRFFLSRITAAGAVFLGGIAILPSLTQKLTNVSTMSIGGTGILIIVSVVLELHRLIENLVQTWRYQSRF